MTPLDQIHAELQELTRGQVTHRVRPKLGKPSPVYLDHLCDEPLHFANDGKRYGAPCPCQAVTIVDGKHYCWTHNKMRLRAKEVA